jgi:hypothetical protein
MASVPVERVIVVNVEGGKLTWKPYIGLTAGQILDGVRTRLRPGTPTEIGEYLSKGLIQNGLFPDEAAALVNTWRSSYFEHDGLRVLFILPQSWTNRFIPLTVMPKPTALARVMVGRIEGLTVARENKVAAALKSGNQAVLAAQGRYLEPILRRLAMRPELKRLCEKLLANPPG